MKYAIAFLITCLLGYLAGSFFSWSFNPATWGVENRGGFLGLTFCALFPAMVITSDLGRR